MSLKNTDVQVLPQNNYIKKKKSLDLGGRHEYVFFEISPGDLAVQPG